nr:hypothetical protein [Tanacetum cinerariifolium]
IQWLISMLPLVKHRQWHHPYELMIKFCHASDGCRLGKATDTLIWKNHKATQSTRLRCQLDEQWFVLTKDTLREALQITHVNNNKAFIAPPSSDALINFVNELGYPKVQREKSSGPGSLIIADIQEASYYQEYLPNVAQHQWYLAGETWSNPESLAPKPAKPARKPKSTTPKAPPRPSVSTPITSAQPAPTSAPAKPQKKKLDKDVPAKEPHIASEDTDLKKALEESMKGMYAAPRGKGKAKVTEEQVTHDLPIFKSPRRKALWINTYSKGAPPNLLDPPDMMNLYMLCLDSQTVRGNYKRLCLGLMRKVKMKARLDQTLVLKLKMSQHNLTLSKWMKGSLQRLIRRYKRISSSRLKTSDKPSEADNDKATAEIEAESMVYVTIQQDTSSIPPMTTPIIDLTSRPGSPKMHQLLKATSIETTTITTTKIHPPPSQQQQSTTDFMIMKRIGELEHIMANLIQDNKQLEKRLDSHWARLYTLEHLDIPHQVSKAVDEVVTDAVDWAMQALLRNRFRDLPEADMKEILHQRMWETDSYKTHEDHMKLYEALENSMNHNHSEELLKDLAEARKKRKRDVIHQKRHLVPPPHPPPPSTNQEGRSKGSAAPSSSMTAALAKYQAWTTTDTRLRPSISLTPVDLQIYDYMAPDAQAQSFDDEDIVNAYIPKNNWASALASTYSPPPEDSLLAQTGYAFEIIKVFHPNVIHLQYQMEEFHKLLTNIVDDSILRHNVSKPLPLGGPPGQVIIQSDFFFNKDLEYLRYGSKGSRPALSISKMKAAYYPDVGLEQVVPDQMWIEEECKYDVAAMYGISHWWFQRQRFYINRHTFEGDRRAVRTHMWILSVVRIEVFSMYGYNYMKKIVLRIESYQTQLNLTKPRWDATGFEYKNDDTVIDSPRSVMFQDRYGVHMIMRFNEIHKFSDCTLQQIDEFWIDEECKYDIAAMYGISHWWFQKQRFYIDRHTSEGDRSVVRTYMRILSVVRIGVFSMYGYDYMKKTVLRRADLNEHVIVERDFKYLYPSNFEYMYLLNLQGHLNHLPPKDKKILTTAVNQWTRHLDESGFKYEVLDKKGRGSEQSVHVRHLEAIEDKEDFPQPGELCWWTRQRGRLQTSEAYRMIKSFRHSRSFSDDL